VPAFKDGFEAVETQFALRPLLSVASHTGGFKKGLNILVKRNTLLVRCGRKFADINFGDIPVIFRRRILGCGGISSQQQSENSQSDCRFHSNVGGNIPGSAMKATSFSASKKSGSHLTNLS
jgi:hypothetical protein